MVAYHVKFNEDFNGLEAGTIARDIVNVRNGRWTYEDRSTRLKRGDILYYWIHVVYHGLGYNLLNQKHVVNGQFEIAKFILKLFFSNTRLTILFLQISISTMDHR